MNGTVGLEAAKVLLIETNFSLNKFDTAKSPVFKKHFGEFKNWVSRSLKYSRFFDRRSSHTRLLIFVYLVLLDGVRYRLYLLNANVRRLMLFFTSLSNQVLFDFASFIFLSENVDDCCECTSQTFS